MRALGLCRGERVAYQPWSNWDGEWMVTKSSNGKEVPVGPRQWSRVRPNLTSAEIARGISAQIKVAPRGFATCSYVTLDFDDHEGASREWMVAWQLRRKREGLKCHPARMSNDRHVESLGWLVSRCHEILAFAEGREGQDPTYVESSPGGFHATVKLDRAVSASEAAGLARIFRAAVVHEARLFAPTNRTVMVQSFPRVNDEGLGVGCALPCGAGLRAVDRSLGHSWGAAFRTRLEDAEDFLSRPEISPDDLRDRCLDVLGLSTVDAFAREEERELRERRAERRGAASTDEDPTGKLKGSAFVLEALRLLEHGMRKGESWHAVRWMTGACLYSGLNDHETTSYMRTWLRRGEHAAEHCASERGQRALMAKVRCLIRHFRQGLTSPKPTGEPWTWRNGLKSDELRAELYGTLGIPVRAPVPRPRACPLSAA